MCNDCEPWNVEIANDDATYADHDVKPRACCPSSIIMHNQYCPRYYYNYNYTLSLIHSTKLYNGFILELVN